MNRITRKKSPIQIKNNKISHVGISLLIVIFFMVDNIILNPIFAQDDIDKKIEYNSDELQKIRDEIKRFKQELEEAKSKEKTITTKLNETGKNISLTEKLISQLKKEQSLKELRIHQSDRIISDLEKKLEKLKSDFAKRLVHIYKKGEMEDIELLLASESFNQAIYRYKYMKILSDIDKNTADEIKYNINKIDKEKIEQERELREKEKILNEKKRYQKELAKQKNQRANQLKLAKKDKNFLSAQIKNKENAAKKLAELIEKLEKEKETRKKELARQRAKRGILDKDMFQKNKGKLHWPVDGKIVLKFGTHKHPTLKTITENSGIDIRVKYGAPVSTVSDGVVTTITYIRGYGTTIIIDHGAGYYSVYTNVEDIRIYEKDYVVAGTEIAYIAKSESGNNNTMHFEIWKNRDKLNPEDWLEKR